MIERGLVEPSTPMLEIVKGSAPKDAIDAVSSATSKYYSSRGLTSTNIGGREWDVTHLHLKEWIDCILTSFPHFVQHFMAQGIPAYFFQAACFDPAINDSLLNRTRNMGIFANKAMQRTLGTRRNFSIPARYQRCVVIQAWFFRSWRPQTR